MCTKFWFDWSTGSNEKDRFSKSRFKALVSKFGESRKKVNLSESGSRDWADQIVWNFNTFKINILTQCVPSFVPIGRLDQMKKTVFQRVVSKRSYQSLAKVGKRSIVSKFGESRKKVNLSESGSRDWADQIVWNFDTFKINILTQCVPSFDSIGRLDQMKKTVFQRVVWGAVVESWAKVGKRSIFRKAVLRIEPTKLSEILTPLRSIS